MFFFIFHFRIWSSWPLYPFCHFIPLIFCTTFIFVYSNQFLLFLFIIWVLVYKENKNKNWRWLDMQNVPGPARPSPAGGPGKKWCVPKPGATDGQLQNNINYICSQGIDCKPIQPGGACFTPNSVKAHASFAMNSYYHTKGLIDGNCDFAGTGSVVSTDPSNSLLFLLIYDMFMLCV